MVLNRRRIMVIGSGGAGKSTFARELARRTGLPLVHLDRHYWRPGWGPTPRDEWAERVRQLSRGDAWIIDGNYGGSLAIRVQRCDAIVFFDVPRLTCVGGVLQRWLAHWFRARPDLPDGCPEKIDMAFLRWIWADPRCRRRPVGGPGPLGANGRGLPYRICACRHPVRGAGRSRAGVAPGGMGRERHWIRHVALAVALGAFGLVVGANVHSLSAESSGQHRQFLLLSLGIWPVMTALPAFLVALVTNVILARVFR